MEVDEYLNERKMLSIHLLDFIENYDYSQEDYTNLIIDINNQKITENKKELELFLHLLLLIANNHHRNSSFFSKIDQILMYLIPTITQTFSNTEIFNIFHKNYRVLLFLIKNDVFKVDEKLMNSVHDLNFHQYFAETNKTDDKHSYKKEIGENDLHICELIRNDSIDEFIIYINQTNYILTNRINYSIYETHSFLMNKSLTLLEYAVFFGSINIVKYLLLHEFKLDESLWLFAIHSNNAEIIQLLEEQQNIIPNNEKKSQGYLEESIKCHHNNIATYIQNNYIQSDKKFHKNALLYSFRFFNYAKMAEYEINNLLFLYACQYKYVELVKLLLNNDKIDINYRLSGNFVIFFI